MKIIPIITALIVSAVLFLLVFERDTLLSFAGASTGQDAGQPAVDVIDTEAAAVEAPDGVGVVAMHSVAQTIDSAVVLRGRTQATREVTVAAETSGLVASEPLRKGVFVTAGQPMCRLDPGARQAALAEARARLTEAEGRVPEVQADVAEAQARRREAEINLNVALSLIHI